MPFVITLLIFCSLIYRCFGIKGQRFDLMENMDEWNIEMNCDYWEYLKNTSSLDTWVDTIPEDNSTAKDAMLTVATIELMDANMPAEDIDTRVEHFKVDEMDETWKVASLWGVGDADPLIAMVVKAFAQHKPIALTPDLIYGYIAKGFAIHIKNHAEELRHLFVQHEGKKTLKYRNDAFVLGSENNPWELVFENFAGQLYNETSGSNLVQNNLRFTTTTPVAIAHRNVLAMEAMESYFEYEFSTACGVASVTLLGELEDWLTLKQVVWKQFKEIKDYVHTNQLHNASLSWWEQPLMTILNKIILAHQSKETGKDNDYSGKLLNKERFGTL